jgi:hypothetical protein
MFCSGAQLTGVKVDAWLSAEEKNTALFLPEYIRLPIIRICEKILISDNLDIFVGYFKEALNDNLKCQLYLCYQLLARVPGGLISCHGIYEKHVLGGGLRAVELISSCKHKGESEHLKKTSAANSTAFANAVAAVVKEGRVTVRDSFTDDQNFVRVLNRACHQFVNWNVFCQYDTDAAEILAQHVEIISQIPGDKISETEIIRFIGDVVCIFHQPLQFVANEESRSLFLNISITRRHSLHNIVEGLPKD